MIRKALIILSLMITVDGCAAHMPHFLKWGGANETDFRQKATAHEKNGELRQALAAWRAAAAFDPDDQKISHTMRVLENEIANAAQAHFKSGLDLYNAGDFVQARREMLTVLRLDPGHPKALYYLKIRLNRLDQQVYKVQRGDSFTKIALDRYKDHSKGYSIAYFNDLDPNKPLLLDTVLFLPLFHPEQYLPRKDMEALVERAQKTVEQKQYKEALAICEKLRQDSPAHPKLQAITDAARLGLGNQRIEQKNYPAALEELRQVTAGYAGRDQAIRDALRFIQRQAAQERILSAQAWFDRGDYAGAITLCEEILAQEPSNDKAKALLHASHYNLGRQMLDQGKEASAIETLRSLSTDYQDSAQLLVQAQARLNARAEEFYRKGVKYFLNEELELAIESWTQALTLNPGHPKARQDMDNALKLLDKWRGLEQGGDFKGK